MTGLAFRSTVEDPAASFRHEALLYTGAEQFVAGTESFVRGALDAGEPILVAVIEPRASMLRDALGADAEHVQFLDMENVGRNPARIIPAWQEWVDRHAPGGRSFRGIGEPIWAGRSPAEIVECQQHEQLLNTAFDEGPGWWLLCPYDLGSLPESVIERAHHTHPSLVAEDVRSGSASYPHPGLSASAMFSEPLAEPSGAVRVLPFDRTQLAEVRQLVADFGEPVLGPGGVKQLVLVVNELMTNSIVHGGGTGVLRLWRESTAVVCETRDAGLIDQPLIGRRRPAGSARGGAGLWIANQLCDLLQIRSAPGLGTIVRAHVSEASLG
jgi:anti-sigma regulatory factor (Ser/Thr protein kinase)